MRHSHIHKTMPHVLKVLCIVTAGQAGLCAQMLMDPATPQGARFAEIFEAEQSGRIKDAGALLCEITRVKPKLHPRGSIAR